MWRQRGRIIVETASEGIWTLDEKDRTTVANRALAEMLGYDQQEMLGRSMFEFMDPEDVEEAQRSLRLRREGVGKQLEFSLRAKDGHKVSPLLATSSLRDRKGEFAGTLAMVPDTTAQKVAGVEHADLAAIVQSSAEAIIGMSTDGVIQSWNEASSRLYGYTAKEALEQHAPSLLARNPSERKQVVARAAGGDDQQQIESQDLSKDGRVID